MNQKIIQTNRNSILYNTLSKIPEKFFENASILMFLFLISWPAIFVYFYYHNYNRFITILPLFYWDTGMFAVLIVLIYFAKKAITTTGWFKQLFKANIWIIIGAVLLLWIGVCSLLSNDSATAIYGSENRSEGFLMYCFYAAFTVCAVIIRTEKKRKLLLYYFSLSSIIVCANVIEQHLHSGSSLYAIGASGPFLHFNHCGYYLALASIASALLIANTHNIFLSLLFTAVYFLDLTTLIINNTFGGYLSVFVGCLCVPFLFWKNVKIKKDYFKLFLPLILFLLVYFAINVIFPNAQFSQTLNKSISTFQSDQLKIVTGAKDIQNAGTGRIRLWQKGMSYCVKSPIFGYGPEGLSPLYAADGFIQNRPANEFIYYIGCFGFPGLFLYLAMLFSLAIRQFKQIKACSPAILTAACLVITYLCSSFFGNSVYYITPYFFMFLGLCSGSNTTAQSL